LLSQLAFIFLTTAVVDSCS